MSPLLTRPSQVLHQNRVVYTRETTRMWPGMKIPAVMQSWAFIISCVLLCFAGIQEFIAKRNRRRKAVQLGCKPAFKVPAWDPIFGIDFLIRGLNALRNRNLLDRYHTIYEDYGTTVNMKVLMMPEIQTIDPDNVQTVLSSGFADFGLGPRRQHFLGPLVGHGIFTTEGPAWKVFARFKTIPSVLRKTCINYLYDLALAATPPSKPHPEPIRQPPHVRKTYPQSPRTGTARQGDC